MKTLYILNTTADLIETTYEFGAFTRKHVVPALVAAYVAITLTIEYFRGPSRQRMIDKLTVEWERIMALDPVSQPASSLEWVWYLESLSDDELKEEYANC